MLCYAMLCYAMLCYAMLCYAMLCYAMLCYAIIYEYVYTYIYIYIEREISHSLAALRQDPQHFTGSTVSTTSSPAVMGTGGKAIHI